ncbi:hypothetical protein [uncultured Flavobacterium sp.]|uniref:hypothetical protein n=1 Tax=uncultured Flavobacterium sp. TaxID=165435 RepID=UPI0025D53043|nr:hypothetical protein [uncultured Flavobacterium sp.]
MKKLLFALFVFASFTASFGQTLLASHPLELKKSKSNHQILNAVNSKNQIFIFATDKEKVKILKYSPFLFFSDSLTINRPYKDYEFMAGYGFEDDGNPCLYWASEDLKKMQSVCFNFETKINKVDNFQFDFKDESILNTFSENNSFYILTLPKKEDKLKFYVLNKGEMDEKVLDFSSYNFTDSQGKPKTFNELITEEGLETIDTKTLNPLFKCVGKSKMYFSENRMILTFDSNTKTQILEINLNNFSISEKNIPQQTMAKNIGKSNSYYFQDKLYMLKTNEEELSIAAVDLKSQEVIKKYYADTKDTISFRNSPLFSQTGDQQGRALKNTKKFLQRLNASDVGLSVYKTPNSIMVTAGGVRNVSSAGNMIIGITAGVAMVATGSGGDVGSLFNAGDLQSTYFEALFDDQFEHQNTPQQELAVDYISKFLSENDVDLQSVFAFKGYYILGYYDSKKKEYVMRKFEDVSEFN